MASILIEARVMIPGRMYSTTGDYVSERIAADCYDSAVAEFQRRHPHAREITSIGIRNTQADWAAMFGANSLTAGHMFADGTVPAHGWNQQTDPRFGMAPEALE